jgi:predicted nucleotidyltransferase
MAGDHRRAQQKFPNRMTEIFQNCVDAADRAELAFLLIGGHAVNARGYQRTTLDLDLLIPAADLSRWKTLMAEIGYESIHETKAFCQFKPMEGEDFRIDLMLVNQPTFGKLLAGSERIKYGHRQIQVVGALHLIALKLHATRTRDRAVQGKDYYDILNLIRLNNINTNSTEFQTILDRYASPSIRERLLSDIQRSF